MITTTTISPKNFFINAHKNIILSDDRKKLLLEISQEIIKEFDKEGIVNLNFICTHNSRRSQLSQVWGFFAADYFDLNIHSYSGGTEVTAFFRNTVKTLQRVGFTFNLQNFSHQNPEYVISFDGSSTSILGFSKRFDHSENKQPFIAITTCNNADANCPFIPEAISRFHLPFVDPKSSDDSSVQDETYLKTNEQIAAEIYYIFSKIKERLT
jgi:arsenate reductase